MKGEIALKRTNISCSVNSEVEKLGYWKLDFKRLESISDCKSLFEIGLRQLFGIGVEENVFQGALKLLDAADRGHPLAIGLLSITEISQSQVLIVQESAARGHAVGMFC